MNDRATELTVGASRSSTVSNNCYKKKESQKGISKGVYETHETQLHCTVVRLVLQKRRDLLRIRGRRLLTMRRRRTAHNKTTSCVRAPKKKGYYYTCLSHHGYQATHRHHHQAGRTMGQSNQKCKETSRYLHSDRFW